MITGPGAAIRLAAIVESSDDAIVSKDLDGIITSWNRAAERMFGYSAVEAIGQSITIIVPIDRLDEEKHVLSQVRAGKIVDHFETIRRKKNGTLFPISLTVSPIREADGTIVGASKIARDISERRAAEAALAAAEARQFDLQRRLVTMIAASSTIFRSPKIDDVEQAIVALARTLVAADAYAMWRFDAGAGHWRIAASSGLSEAFASQVIAADRGLAAAPLGFTEPLVVENADDTAMLGERAAALRAEGIRSMIAVPLAIGGQGSGALVFYCRTAHSFNQVEVQTARALGDLAGAATSTALMYDEQRKLREQAERANRQAAFLAEASAALGASLDYEATLKTVAQLAVPHIADWCGVSIVDDNGDVQRLAVAHVDPARGDEARTFLDRYPLAAGSPASATQAIRTGEPSLIQRVTDEMLTATARDDDHLRAMRSLGIRSILVVPLAAHRRTFGALTFVAAESGRVFSDSDLRFAQDLGYRAALAVENARAYRQAYAANRAKDEFLAMLSHEFADAAQRGSRMGAHAAQRRGRAGQNGSRI